MLSRTCSLMRADTGRREGAVPFAGVSGKWAKKISDREIPEASVPAVIVVQAISIATNVQWLYSTVKDEESAATLLCEKDLLHQERLRPCGTHRTSLPLYLCELIWRKRLASGDDPFEKLLQDIAMLYPSQ
ncbi:hypothetical protein M514_13479 [Trichuris suis]|uniref:Uncharacterized protein n=1 Tax=Trichuris suis TaxID=68888 RepID=A0A085MXP5_9BILA|nr:hypothetical protein M513_13479 [Trichuris suis]KFD61991.1 hypothetical protein M514_13479 [Trichuris suis]